INADNTCCPCESVVTLAPACKCRCPCPIRSFSRRTRLHPEAGFFLSYPHRWIKQFLVLVERETVGHASDVVAHGAVQPDFVDQRLSRFGHLARLRGETLREAPQRPVRVVP